MIKSFLQSLLLSLSAVVLGTSLLHAQSVTIGAGAISGTSSNGATGDSGPMYRSSATSGFVWSRHHYLYTQAELAAAGLPAGSLITSLSWFKDNVATNNTPDTFQVYMKNSALTAVQAPPQTFATLIAGSTQVFSSTTYIVPNAAGPVTVTFGTPFLYTGGALEITTFADNTGLTTAGFSWKRDNISNRTISYVGTTDNTTLSNARTVRPQLQINYTPGSNCTAPPTAGTTTSSVSGAICAGTNVSFSLTGNSIGAGQTYQLQSAPSLSGPYTNVGASGSGPSGSAAPITTAFYRYLVTCSGQTDSSTPVQVLVNPVLAAGTYTINNALPASATNFPTFTAAASALSCGIGGPIEFNVANNATPYNEQIILPNIPTTSATNIITFNGNGATLNYTSANSNQRAAILLDGADYVRIKRLNIASLPGSTYGYGIHLTNDANNVLIDSCNVTSDTTATGTAFAGIVVSGSVSSATTTGSNCDTITITNNVVNGGYYGISYQGNATTNSEAITISNNVVKNFYFYGLYTGHMNASVIENNDISRPTRTVVGGTFYGIYGNNPCPATRISRNRIHDPQPAALATLVNLYGIYHTGADATAAAPMDVSNNLIYNFRGEDIIYGIYNGSSDYVRYYHNTVSLDDALSSTTAVTRGFYQVTTATGIELKNNIFSVTRGGTGIKHAVYFGAAGTTYSARSNVYYVTSPGATGGIAYFNSTNYSTLAAYQTASLQDTATIDADPVFVNTGGSTIASYAPTSASVNNIGTPLSSVPTDILGTPRNVLTPDPGVLEFTPSGCTSPPTAGTVTASDTVICSGTTVSFDLNGNSFGLGQTYVWQTSPTLNGPYTPVSTSSALPSYSQVVTTTAYFRAAVTCGTSTVFSDTQLVAVLSPLAGGTYTINAASPASATNFQSFGSATQAMRCGITGPVVVNVVAGSGPYSEQLYLPGSVSGTSATNTITFNGNNNVLNFTASNASRRGAITLDGVDWVTVNNLVINVNSTAATYGFGVHLTNDADNNTIRNCTVNIDTAVTSSGFAGMVMSGTTSATGTGSNCDSNRFLNNTITGGYYGMTSIGASTQLISGNVMRGNVVRDYYLYGSYHTYNSGLLVDSNNFSRPTRTTLTTFYGTFLTTGNVACSVTRNRVHNPCGGNLANTSQISGIYVSADAAAGQENVVANNLIYNFNGQGVQYGLYNSGGPFVRYLHNTVSLDDTTSTTTSVTRGFYQTGTATDIDIRNNIFSLRRTGTGAKQVLYFATAATTFTSNYNDLYIAPNAGTTNQIGYYNAIGYTTLSAWQQGAGKDSVSVDLNPMFVNAVGGNLTPTNVAIDNMGQPVGITQDAFGNPRSLITPDLGAIEWSFIPACNAPTALNDNAAATSANIGWTASTSTNVGYEYTLSTSSAVPSGAGIPVSASPVTLTGLTAGTTYYWFVRTVCGPTSYSAYVGDSFTTCTPPSATLLAIGSSTPTTAIAVCQGDTAVLRATGGAGNTYLFLRNGSVVGAGATSDSVLRTTQGGTYRVVVTNATGCFDTSAAAGIVVTVNPLPTPTITQTSFNQLSTGSFTTYQWNLAGTPISGATQQTYTAPVTGNGSYTVTVTDANGCRATSPAYNLTTASVGGAAGAAATIRIFPNPTNGLLYIESPKDVTAQVWTLDGRKLLDVSKAKSVDMRSFASGVYMLRVLNADGVVLVTERVTKAD